MDKESAVFVYRVVGAFLAEGVDVRRPGLAVGKPDRDVVVIRKVSERGRPMW